MMHINALRRSCVHAAKRTLAPAAKGSNLSLIALGNVGIHLGGTDLGEMLVSASCLVPILSNCPKVLHGRALGAFMAHALRCKYSSASCSPLRPQALIKWWETFLHSTVPSSFNTLSQICANFSWTCSGEGTHLMLSAAACSYFASEAMRLRSKKVRVNTEPKHSEKGVEGVV